MNNTELKKTFQAELLHIYGFWKSLYDEKGGYTGQVDFALHHDANAEKGVILHARILWFFSNVYLSAGEADALFYARHAYEFLMNHAFDREYGGMFWMLDAAGNSLDDMKHTYNQVFCIYGLSSYYLASGDKTALNTAYRLFETVEERCADEYGYAEAFTRDWQPILNEKLSEDGFQAEKTMNTLLHLIEAYTELYRADGSERVKERLLHALSLAYDKVYDPNTHILGVYFDRRMRSIANVYSYGHDIEASWLIDRALDVLGDFSGAQRLREMNAAIAQKVYATAYTGELVYNQSIDGEVDKTRIWWIECESVVGFLNAFQRTGKAEYAEAAQRIWEYTRKNFVDTRAGAEWFYALNEQDSPIESYPVAGAWKCPYHNGRMCLEGMNRL